MIGLVVDITPFTKLALLSEYYLDNMDEVIEGVYLGSAGNTIDPYIYLFESICLSLLSNFTYTFKNLIPL